MIRIFKGSRLNPSTATHKKPASCGLNVFFASKSTMLYCVGLNFRIVTVGPNGETAGNVAFALLPSGKRASISGNFPENSLPALFAMRLASRKTFPARASIETLVLHMPNCLWKTNTLRLKPFSITSSKKGSRIKEPTSRKPTLWSIT